MRIILALCSMLMLSCIITAQTNTEKEAVERACMNYIEGFYEGDTKKLEASLQPQLYKFGFMKNKDTNAYQQVAEMSYDAAMVYANDVKEKQRFPKPDAPKEVMVLDIGNHIAAARVTAWWGIDYLLLSKTDDGWMIEQVLWEGPLQKSHLEN